MKPILLVLVAVAQVTTGFAAEAPPSRESVPPDIARLVPKGWVSTQSVKGDLNGDGMVDLVAILLRGDLADGNPVEQAGDRGLLVLFADSAGGYRFQDLAVEALPCAACLGDIDGDPKAPVFELAVAEGRLTVGWRRDSPEISEVELIIGYDRERGVLRLLGDQTDAIGRLSDGSSRLIRDYITGTMTRNGQESSFPPRFIPLTEVSAEDY